MATSTDLRSAIEEVQQSLPVDQVHDEAAAGAYEPGAFDRLARRVGALPWWVISATVHAVVFLLIALLAVAAPPPTVDEVVIATEVVKQKPPEFDQAKPRDIFRNTKDVQAEARVENPVVTHETVEQAATFQTDNAVDDNRSRGTEDAISDIPLGGTGTVGSIGVGGGGLAGVFGYRDAGGRKKATARFGGTQVTESSVEAALAWLARHQEKDGHWDPTKWDKGMGPVGMTGLAMLAFLGAGYTSKDPSRFTDVVRRAENWLLTYGDEMRKKYPWEKIPEGNWRCQMYEQGMGTLALAEAYGMTKDPRLLKQAQASVDFIVAAQGSYEAWNYGPKAGKPGRNDTSVSGWNLMALKSAKIAGLKVDGAAFNGCLRWLDGAASKANGYCNYAATMDTVKAGENSNLAMASAGMLMRQFMGAPREDEFLVAAAKLLSKDANLPEWAGDKDEKVNFYYWYYGTLCMFQMGGDYWTKWNKKIQAALVPHQCKGGPLDGSEQDKDGSWDPVGGGYVPTGGRVFSTALGALTLEVYYRYLPLYSK